MAGVALRASHLPDWIPQPRAGFSSVGVELCELLPGCATNHARAMKRNSGLPRFDPLGEQRQKVVPAHFPGSIGAKGVQQAVVALHFVRVIAEFPDLVRAYHEAIWKLLDQ